VWWVGRGELGGMELGQMGSVGSEWIIGGGSSWVRSTGIGRDEVGWGCAEGVVGFGLMWSRITTERFMSNQ